MARYKPYDYNQLMMVSVSLEDQLVPVTLEYAIHHVVQDRLDMSVFESDTAMMTQGARLLIPRC